MQTKRHASYVYGVGATTNGIGNDGSAARGRTQRRSTVDEELTEIIVKVHVLVDTAQSDWRQAAFEQARDIFREDDPDNVVIEAA